MLLNCPKCDKSMSQVHSSKRGISLDKCTSCHGFWIEKSDLDKLFKQEYDFNFSHYLDPHSLHKKDLECPLCGHKLFQGKTKQNNLEIELCRTCEGVYVDQGELNQLINIEMDQSSKQPEPMLPSKSKNNLLENQKINRNESKATLKEFLKILDNNENIIWNSKPSFFAYFCINIIPQIFIFLFTLAFSLMIFNDGPKTSASPNYNLFFCFALIFSFLCLVSSISKYLNRAFVVTNKRVIESTGFFGVDYRSIDFKKATDTNLNVSFFEKLLGLGTINLRSASGESVNFIFIKKSHEVYKLIKSLSQK